MPRKKPLRKSTMKRQAEQAWYALKDVPNKGKGLVATQNIPLGTRILSEEPLITIPIRESLEERRRLICQQVHSLSNDQRNAFLSMHNVYPFNDTAQQYTGIFRTNGLPTEESPDKAAIFLEACRINHDCEYNAMHNWNEKIKRHTVHAIRDIKAGEEITLTYVFHLESRETRQKTLKESFSFACLCRLCSLPEGQSKEHDRKLEQIIRMNELMKDGVLKFMVSPLTFLGYVYTKARCYTELGQKDCGYGQAYEEASSIAIANGDLARGRLFAQRAASVWKILIGNDSPRTKAQEKFAQDPSRHALHGFSMRWKTAVEEVPQGLEHNDFEDWLWRRPKPQTLAQPMSSWSQSSFSGFVDLPYKNGIDTGVSDDPFKTHHSCFLGEIVAKTCHDPLDLEIKDIHDKKTTIHFYTQDRGRKFECQRGYTVAILDASQYDFKFGPPGIRHEDPRMIKVINYICSNSELLTSSLECTIVGFKIADA
ncbi:hypothetical protein E4U30_002609 [Claviceps sp. LM220 group G6]|nr:hypothetical protein E4U30_002609 [Claviceps sp. LM220 group G6]